MKPESSAYSVENWKLKVENANRQLKANFVLLVPPFVFFVFKKDRKPQSTQRKNINHKKTKNTNYRKLIFFAPEVKIVLNLHLFTNFFKENFVVIVFKW